MKNLDVLSLGAGVQSTALLMLAAEGRLPQLDAAVFADTGWEPQPVYDHLERIRVEVADPAGIPIIVRSVGSIHDDALNPQARFATMPFFVKNADGTQGMVRRQCTAEYKVRPIKEAVRELLGARPKANGRPGTPPRGRQARQWIGISTDEFHRAKDSDVGYIKHVFPLLDMNWSRNDCLAYLTARGWGDTPKSACKGCPFRSNRQWRDLRQNSPEDFADAVAFDAAIRNGSARANANGDPLRGEYYLHRSMLPLADAPLTSTSRSDLKADQLTFTCSPFSCEGDEAATVADLGWDVIP